MYLSEKVDENSNTMIKYCFLPIGYDVQSDRLKNYSSRREADQGGKGQTRERERERMKPPWRSQ